MSEYENIKAVNKSTLWEMRKSPLHYWHLMHDTPRKDTPAMKLGRAVHARLLQPETFDDGYVVVPDCDRRTKAGKALWTDLLETGKELISGEDMETILAMEKEFANIRKAPFWKSPETEIGLTWTDSESGVACKARLDAITDDYVIDYKTTTDASTAAFQREALKYGYDLQAAMYLDAARANGYSPKGFIFIAQEKTAPYLINIIHAGSAFLDRGAWIMRDLLAKWKECSESGVWPGYGENELVLREWEVMDDE